MPHTSMRGLWLATYGLGLIFVQLVSGLVLRYTGARTAQTLRRIHFVLMLSIVGLVLAHLWLNGPLFDVL
jgi:thiosulfate reductase cytochrome b subunit